MSHRDIALEAAELEKLLHQCFPSLAVQDYGNSAFESLVGNVRAAVTDEIIALVETWLETLEEASQMPYFHKRIPARDWVVAKSHILDLISEIKQYRTKGLSGHTGPNRVIDSGDSPCDD